MNDFWEAGTSKIVFPCRRRAYFAKTGRRGNGCEKVLNGSPNGSQNGAKIYPWGVLGRIFVILRLFWGMSFLLNCWSAKKCINKTKK